MEICGWESWLLAWSQGWGREVLCRQDPLGGWPYGYMWETDLSLFACLCPHIEESEPQMASYG